MRRSANQRETLDLGGLAGSGESFFVAYGVLLLFQFAFNLVIDDAIDPLHINSLPGISRPDDPAVSEVVEGQLHAKNEISKH